MKNKIPEKFNLGGRTWHVLYQDEIDKGQVFAKWYDSNAEILLALNVLEDGELTPCTEYQLINSFWHEYGHILQYYSQGNTDDTFAQTFATFITEFINTQTFNNETSNQSES